jgi:hypothetical protein
MSADVSLEELFQEQQAANLFLIKPLDKEFVHMKPWSPNDRCACGGFQKVPRSAIQRVRTTGKTAQCCGKLMQIVAVEFSDKPALTYASLFVALRNCKSAPRFPRIIMRPPRQPRTGPTHSIPTIWPFPDPGDPGDPNDPNNPGYGDDGDGESAGEFYVNCVQACLQAGRATEPTPKYSQAWFQWYRSTLEDCSASCAALVNGATIVVMPDDPPPDPPDPPPAS